MKLSKTNQRRVIIEELKKLKTHPTADELYSIVRRKLPQISLGTVYRNLDVLSEAGKIWKLELGGKQRRFDGNIKLHHHLRCVECGCVEDLELEDMEPVEEILARKVDGRIKGWSLEFQGLCEKCGEESQERDELEG